VSKPESTHELPSLRCYGLMVTIRLEDAGSSSLCFSAWRCLLCGEVRFGDHSESGRLHGPTGSQDRVRYGVLLVR